MMVPQIESDDTVISTTWNGMQVGPRVLGLIQSVDAVGQIAMGVPAVILAPAPWWKAGAAVIVLRGLDNLVAGGRTMISGETIDTGLHVAIESATGSDLAATVTENVVDAVLPAGDAAVMARGVIGANKKLRIVDDIAPKGTIKPPIRSPGRAPEFPAGRLHEDQVLDRALDYLGPGYREASPGRYVSADKLRQFRYGAHELRNPAKHHCHFEALDEFGHVIENSVVEIFK